MDEETFVTESIKHVINGVSIIGGCCGTTPAFIAALKKNLPSKKQNLLLSTLQEYRVELKQLNLIIML